GGVGNHGIQASQIMRGIDGGPTCALAANIRNHGNVGAAVTEAGAENAFVADLQARKNDRRIPKHDACGIWPAHVSMDNSDAANVDAISRSHTDMATGQGK